MFDAEAQRLAALREFAVLDSLPEERFDRLTNLAATLFDAPIALVSLIDNERQWFKSRVGLDATQTPRAWAFCDHAIKAGPDATLVVEDATLDSRFADNPLVTGDPRIRFYAGAALTTSKGFNLGTLCVIDQTPRSHPSAEAMRRLSVLARMVVDELELSRASHAVAEQRRILELAEAMSGVGHWRYDYGAGRVNWSDEVYKIHGVERENFDPNLDDAIGFYHPEDQARVSSLIARAATHGEDFAFRLRLIRPDGRLRHVSCKASCELNGEGGAKALIGVFQDITDEVDTLAAVERSEARYRRLTENANDIVTKIDSRGRFLYVSPAVTAMTGYSVEEVVGRLALDFIHPGDKARVEKTLLDALKGNSGWQIEYRLIRKDGRTIWVDARPSLARDSLTGEILGVTDVIRDITDRRATEDALAHSEARYRLLADNASDVIARLKPGGQITFITPSCEKILGFTPEEMVGRRALDMAHPDDVVTLRAYYRDLHNTTGMMPEPVQFRARHRDGRWVWLEGQPRIFFDPATGRAVEIQDAVRDITKHKELEFALEQARADAEAAAAAKSEFLANMSHELRTPLNGVLGFTDLLRRGELDGDQRLYVDRIVSAGRSLLEVINDILDFSKIEAGRLSVESRPYDLKTVIDEVVGLVQAANPNLPVALNRSFAVGLAEAYIGDEHRVRQIITNVVGNAFKFTREGAVSLAAEISGDRLRIIVIDTGPGIAADKLAAVFDGFTQADSSIARQYGGTGLGLPISRSLARLMGGDLTLESELGFGAKLTLTLPNAPCARLERRFAEPPEPVSPPRKTANPLRIMMVDDVEMNRELVELSLGHVGYRVQGFSSAKAAIDVLKRGDAFDVILMDVQMPDMDGLTATRLIRQLEGPIRSVPIIALTANAMSEQATACLAAGMDEHLAKPIDMTALLSTLRRIEPAGGGDTAAAPPKTSDPLAALRERYGAYLRGLPNEIAALGGADHDVKRVQTLASLAHSVAGTSGSFGFRAVSDAAFALEAVAKDVLANTADKPDLARAVDQFLLRVADPAT